MLEYIERINTTVNAVVWGAPLMVLIIGTGVYLTVRLRFLQFTHIGHIWRATFFPKSHGRCLLSWRRKMQHSIGHPSEGG